MAFQRKHIAIPIAVIVVLAVGGLAYLRYAGPGNGAPGDLVLYGNVDVRQVELAFNIDGRIESMLAEEGALVNRDQVLARLDDSRYRDAVAAARAKAAAAEAVVARLEAGARPQEIEKAKADVRAAEGTWHTAQATLERRRSLALDKFASQQALDEARALEREAKGKLDALRQILALTLEGPRKEDIAEAKAQLSAAKAELALAQHKLDDTTLRSSVDGTVLTRIQEPGAVILANTPVYSVALADPLWVRAYVSEPDLGRVYPGMGAEITTDSAPDRVYQGWVGFISPTAEFTPKTVETTEIRTSLVYRLRVYVGNPGNALRQGMPVTVRLIEESEQNRPARSPTAPAD